MPSVGEDPEGWQERQRYPSLDEMQSRQPDRKEPRDWATRVVAIAAVIGLVLAVPAAIWYFKEISGSSTTSASGSPRPTPSDSASPSAPAVAQAVAPSSPCFAAGVGIACSAPHDAEVFTTTTCDLNGLITFMGGNPTIEILRDGLTVTPDPGGCLVGGLDAFGVTSSVASILQNAAGDVFRVCHDKATATEVGCSTRHSGELIYRNAADVDCAQAFQTYTGDVFSKRSADLRLTKSAGTTVECWVEPRLANPLTASLRNLEDKTLPIGTP